MSPQAQQILAQLKDINTTAELGLQIPWGVWLVVFLILILAIVLIIFLSKKQRTRAIKKSFIMELDNLVNISDNKFIPQIAILLRRYLQYQYNNENIKGLNQEQFVSLLDSKLALNDELKTLLLENIYKKSIVIDRELLTNYAKKLIKYV